MNESNGLIMIVLLGVAALTAPAVLFGPRRPLDRLAGLAGLLLLLIVLAYYNNPAYRAQDPVHPVVRYWYGYAAVLGYFGFRATQWRDGLQGHGD